MIHAMIVYFITEPSGDFKTYLLCTVYEHSKKRLYRVAAGRVWARHENTRLDLYA